MSKFTGLMNSSQSAGRAGSANDECKETLHDVIDLLIPRLLGSQNYGARLAEQEISEKNPEPFSQFMAFTQACRLGDSLQINQIVDGLLEEGVAHERIFLDLITPAARQLGAWWDKDLCSFTEVTCGLAMMHQVTYRLGYEFREGPQVEGEQTHVMLCCAPGSLHFLGASIVGDLFKREGASVVMDISSTEQELVRTVANEWFDVIGISVAIEAQLMGLKPLVEALKKSSGNPQVKVLLGGPIFMLVDATPQMFGADAICNNPSEVLSFLKGFVIQPDRKV